MNTININGIDLIDFPQEMVIKHFRDTGSFETFSMRLWREISQYQQFNGIWIDGGCYSGIYAICALQNLGNRVWAFDINPALVERTRENAKFNRVEKRLSVHNLGLSNFVGISHVNAKFTYSSAGKLAQTGNFRVPVSKIDTILNAYGSPVKVQGIKLDLEGEEIHALEGAKKTIARDRSFIICECLTQTALDEVQAYFCDLDYACMFISSDGNLIAWCPDKHTGFGGLK